MADVLNRMRAGDRDAGVTLVELLMVMVMFAIVLTLVTAALIGVMRDTNRIQYRTDAIDQSRLAVAEIDRQIRSGNVLYNPASDPDATAASMNNPAAKMWQMRIYTQANGLERCVQWQVTNGILRTRSWTPTWQTDGVVSPWKTVARGVVNTTTQAPFALRGGGTSSSYGARLLDLSFYTQTSSKGGTPVQVGDSLSGRNTVYGYDSGTCAPVPAP
jgi:type II secretory pathway component PulJ